MRVGIFTDTYAPDINGVATATANLRDALIKLGHQVDVVTTNVEGATKAEEKDGVVRIPGVVMKKLYSYRAAGIFHPRVYGWIKRKRWDVIHVQTEAGIGTFGRIASKLLGIPMVYTYHTMYTDYSFYLKNYFLLTMKTAIHLMEAFSKNWALSPDEIITPSLKTQRALVSYGVRRYINIVPSGMDFASLQEASNRSDEVERVRREFDLEGKTSFLVVGRLGKEKGIDFLLQCFRKLVDERGEGYRLLIAGNGAYRKELCKLSSSLGLEGKVFFLGFVPHDEIGVYYRACDAILSGSLTETQGLAVCEAMACRRIPLVREDLNFKPLIQDGESGFFFQGVDSFVEKVSRIEGMSAEERERMEENAYRVNLEMNSLEAFGRKVEYVYRKALRDNW